MCWNQIFFCLRRRIRSCIFQSLWFMGKQRVTITWSKMNHYQKSSQKKKGAEMAVSGTGVSGHAFPTERQPGVPGEGSGYRLGSSVRYCTREQPFGLKNKRCNAHGLSRLFTWPQLRAGVRTAVVGWRLNSAGPRQHSDSRDWGRRPRGGGRRRGSRSSSCLLKAGHLCGSVITAGVSTCAVMRLEFLFSQKQVNLTQGTFEAATASNRGGSVVQGNF